MFDCFCSFLPRWRKLSLTAFVLFDVFKRFLFDVPRPYLSEGAACPCHCLSISYFNCFHLSFQVFVSSSFNFSFISRFVYCSFTLHIILRFLLVLYWSSPLFINASFSSLISTMLEAHQGESGFFCFCRWYSLYFLIILFFTDAALLQPCSRVAFSFVGGSPLRLPHPSAGPTR